jgi:CheY-like chemotaxis protein
VRALVVEDDADARDLVQAVLGQYGAEVESVASADEALEMIARRPPDVLVSDIGLPTADGYDLIRRVRALPQGSRLPALALTAYAGIADHRRALEAGFQRHVPKPVEPGELASIVAAMVTEARQPIAASASPGSAPLMMAAAPHS